MLYLLEGKVKRFVPKVLTTCKEWVGRGEYDEGLRVAGLGRTWSYEGNRLLGK